MARREPLTLAALSLLTPTLPPYDPLDWAKKPLPERARMVCEAWALEGYGLPTGHPLERLYDRKTSVGLVGKVMASASCISTERALPELIPRAVPRLEDYEYLDGELIAGPVLGWNFGDGHLHGEQLRNRTTVRAESS